MVLNILKNMLLSCRLSLFLHYALYTAYAGSFLTACLFLIGRLFFGLCFLQYLSFLQVQRTKA